MTNQNVSLFGVGNKSQHFLLRELFLDSSRREKKKKKDQKNASDITSLTCMEGEEEEGNEKRKGKEETLMSQ